MAKSELIHLSTRRWLSLVAASLTIAAAPTAIAGAQSAEAALSRVPRSMERQREIALALSSCPTSLASQAAVYVLGTSGYVKAREGRNGFTAIVQHALATSQEPQCMDAEGARAFLPRILKVAELRAQGKSAEEIQRFAADASAKGIFPAPTRPGVIYMLSTENILGGDKPFPPHVMFYGTHLTNADLGSDGNQDGPAFVAGEGAHALIIVPIGAHAPDKRPGGRQ